jgi:hypothetical protein
MLSRNDPRVRRALDQLAQTLESANSRTQEGLFSFAQTYVSPCLASVGGCLAACVEPCRACWEEEEQRRRRLQQAARGRAELSFDFYDDWEEEEADPLLGGDGVEEEPAAAVSGGTVSGGTVREGGGGWLRGRARERTMSYGAVAGGASGKSGGGKGKQLVAPPDEDAPMIRSSSYFGFLESLPFRLGAKGLRYQPSIADLQDHPGSRRRLYSEEQPLLDGSDADEGTAAEAGKRRKPAQLPAMRKRSGTQGSGHTTDSFSSRGDIFPSEDEMDDAVPLDDEFALHLERRTVGGHAEDRSSGSSARNRSASSRASLLSGGSGRGMPPKSRILSPASLFGPSDVPAEERKRVPQRSRSSPELDSISSARPLPDQTSKSFSHSPLLNGLADAPAKPPIVTQLPPPAMESHPPPAVESHPPPAVESNPLPPVLQPNPLPPPVVESTHTPTDSELSQADRRWVAAALPNFSP